MIDVVLSLVPVFALIAVGAFLRRVKLLEKGGWAALERLTYFVLFPPLLFTSIVGGTFEGGEAVRLGGSLVAAALILAGLTMALKPVLGVTGGQFTSIFQCAIRWNGYVALGVIAGLYGDEGLALSAVGFAALVPVNNLMSVLVLTRYAGTEPAPLGQVLKSLATNPLIIAVLLASAFVVAGVSLPEPAMETLNLLGQATIALGLLCVGAALDFSAMRAAKLPVAVGSLLRLAVMPVLAATLALLAGLGGAPYMIVVICAAAPTATSAYILARQLGGDATLMANMITMTTLLSLATIPAVIWLAGLAGA